MQEHPVLDKEYFSGGGTILGKHRSLIQVAVCCVGRDGEENCISNKN